MRAVSSQSFQRTLALASVASLALAGSAFAQGSATQRTYNSPLGQITHTQSTGNVGNGTVTTNTITPGNNSRVTPYVGATTFDTDPGRTQSNTAYHAGISVPLGSSPPSTSTPTPPPSAPVNFEPSNDGGDPD